jgi:hypothetical protein
MILIHDRITNKHEHYCDNLREKTMGYPSGDTHKTRLVCNNFIKECDNVHCLIKESEGDVCLQCLSLIDDDGLRIENS